MKKIASKKIKLNLSKIICIIYDIKISLSQKKLKVQILNNLILKCET